MNRLNLNQDSNPTVLVVILVAVVGWLLSRVRTASDRSRKLGTFAVACGLTAFVPALIGPIFKDPSQARVLAICGVLTLLLAITSIVLAIWTFRARRRDQGVSIAFPVLGLLCGVANLFCGAGLFLTGSGALVPTAGSGIFGSSEVTPRTWRSEVHGFEVTLPSEDWATTPNPNVLVAFTGNRPPFMAMVAEARQARTDADYNAVLAFGRKVRDDSPTTDTVERSGTNRNGHPHWVYMGWATGPKGPYYFGMSITRVRDKAVVMMFEGQGRLSSEAGRAQETLALRNQADLFLGSVK